MRQAIVFAVFLLSIATPSLAQEQLIVGNTYSGNVKLSAPDNGVYLALPEGAWLLIALEDSRTSPINTGKVLPVIRGRLIRTDDKKRITGIVGFESANGSSSGWTTSSFCSRKDMFFIQTKIQNRSAKEKKCWGVYPYAIGQPAANSSQYIRDFHQYVALNGLLKPLSLIAVQFYRSNLNKYIHAYYYFNPELDGFPRSAMSTWQKDVVVGDAKRVQYLDSKKAWGEQWLPTFEAAFNGRVK